jgi:hypothetical protein
MPMHGDAEEEGVVILRRLKGGWNGRDTERV